MYELRALFLGILLIVFIGGSGCTNTHHSQMAWDFETEAIGGGDVNWSAEQIEEKVYERAQKGWIISDGFVIPANPPHTTRSGIVLLFKRAKQ